MKQKIELDISVWVIIKVILVLVSVGLLYFIRDILLLLFVVFVLVATFNPVVNSWEKKIKRGPAVLTLTAIFLVIFSFLVYIVVPPIVSQFSQFVDNLPNLINNFKIFQSENNYIKQGLSSLTQNASSLTGGFLSLTAGFFGGLASFFTVLIITIYMLLDENGLKKIINIFPTEKKEEVVLFVRKISDKIGGWFRGQMILVFTIGIIDTIALFALGIPYALTLGVISGILEFVPIIGPISAGAIAALVALTAASPVKALIVVIVYIIVQQLENNVLVPKIMQKAVGLSPVIIITAVLIGSRLLGMTGALFAVPIAALISVVVSEWSSVKSVFLKDE